MGTASPLDNCVVLLVPDVARLTPFPRGAGATNGLGVVNPEDQASASGTPAVGVIPINAAVERRGGVCTFELLSTGWGVEAGGAMSEA